MWINFAVVISCMGVMLTTFKTKIYLKHFSFLSNNCQKTGNIRTGTEIVNLCINLLLIYFSYLFIIIGFIKFFAVFQEHFVSWSRTFIEYCGAFVDQIQQLCQNSFIRMLIIFFFFFFFLRNKKYDFSQNFITYIFFQRTHLHRSMKKRKSYNFFVE